MRSRTSEIMGLHLQDNKDFERIIAVNAKTYTILDEQASIIPAIRARIPDAVFCLRLRQINPVDWSAHTPEGQANKGVSIARQYMQPQDFVTPANEMNLSLEKGDNPINMQTIYQEIGAWSRRFAEEWRRLGSPCGIVSPALSPGHSEDQEDEPGIIGYEIMQADWALYDLIGVHCYWLAVGSPSLTDVNGLARYYAFRNCDTYRQWWPNHDCWLGEWNTGGWVFDMSKWQPYANECDWYLRRLAERPWVRAATHFIFDSWDQPYQISKAEPVYQRFVSIGHELFGPPGPTPEPPPEPPPIPAGEIARIEAKYNITHADSADVVLAELAVRGDPNNIEAYGPSDLKVRVATKDEQHFHEGMGHAEMAFNQGAKYYPTQGQTGYFYATCGGARVDGLGWPFGVPGDTGAHTNVVPRFARRTAPPEPEPEPPIPPTLEWFGAFAGFAAANPWVGQATGEIVYAPSAWVGAIQEGTGAYLVWNGATVTAVRKPNTAAASDAAAQGVLL